MEWSLINETNNDLYHEAWFRRIGSNIASWMLQPNHYLTGWQLWVPTWSPFWGPLPTLQWKGQWESNINVWFPFMYSQKLNFYFQNRIIMFCFPVPSLIYFREIDIFPVSVCLFCCREICGPILGILYKSLTDTWMWKLGLRPRNSQKRNT